MAWLVLLLDILLLHGDARSRNFLVSGSILILPPYAEREKKPSEYCAFAFADGGNPTQAASTASKRTIHYTIAPRLPLYLIPYHCLVQEQLDLN